MPGQIALPLKRVNIGEEEFNDRRDLGQHEATSRQSTEASVGLLCIRETSLPPPPASNYERFLRIIITVSLNHTYLLVTLNLVSA
jgi:hypothetical protein